MSTCKDCGQDKPLHQFGASCVRCHDCHRARQKRYDEKRKHSARRQESRHASAIRVGERRRGGPSGKTLVKQAAAKGLRYCGRCKQEKESSEFYRTAKSTTWCRSCWSTYCAERRRDPNTGERMRQREQVLRRQPHRLEQSRRRYLKKAYGLTVEEYQALWDEQNGLCAICRAAFPPGARDILANGSRGVDIDHCHDRGIVRGLLCPRCNKGIGMLGHDPAVLRNAAAYLD